MNLANSVDTINYFSFQLQSELLEKRRDKFLKIYKCIDHLIQYFGSDFM